MSDIFDRKVHCILGLPFDAINLPAAVRKIQEAASRKEKCFLTTPNLNWLVACKDDVVLRDSVIDSDLSVADGMPLVWVAKWLGIPITERVAGSTIFEGLRSSKTQRLRVFFFGGPEGVAAEACARLNEKEEGLLGAGHESPGFGSVEDMSSEETIAGINNSNADFVVVALGAKKGQAWIERNRARLSAPVISHLGAVVNFVAGTVSRAPDWMQRSGLEWLWRIKEEGGLWRRYYADGLAFLHLLLTRVFPHAWFLHFRQRSPQEVTGATAELREDTGEIVITFRGAWFESNLTPARECFRRAAGAQKDVRLDLAAVSFMDSSFVGLLMLLAGACRRQKLHLDFGQPSDTVKRILRYSGADFLLRDRLRSD